MKRVFFVQAGLMPEFSDLLAENNLANEIVGSTDDSEIEIEVHYRANQSNEILELVDWLEENSEIEDSEEESELEEESDQDFED
jgi:uncharacterized protein (DUF608 family)